VSGLAPHPISKEASAVARHGGIAPTRWDRLSNDAYFTIEAHWIIPALLAKVRITGPVLEPAAGVGHLVRELRRGHGLEVVATDLTAYDKPLVPDIEVRDIWSIASLQGFRWAITNLPYKQPEHDKLAAHLVALGARDGCGVALLTRAEWIVARRRRSLVHQHPNFAGVVFLRSRPRWSDVNIASPRHNFIWAVWSVEPRPAGVLPWVQFSDRTPAYRGARGPATPTRKTLTAASSSS
jgi:hypothetical protein